MDKEYVEPEVINASAHDHYTEYYDDETIDIVSRLYSRDIDLYEYEFE